MKNTTTNRKEYRIYFYVDGSLWDVIACTSQKRLMIIADALCKKYGECTVTGATVDSYWD